MKINTIILDIGNVLADFCWEKFFRSFDISEETFEKLAKATVLDTSWDEFDKGIMSENEILQSFITKAPELETLIRKIFSNINGTIEVYDYTVPWIRELKSMGYKVLILSNFSEKCYRECGNKMDFVKEADGAVISYLEKMIKPNKEIYQLIIERYQLVPENCVFIDDRPVNVEGAKNSGMQGIVFKNREDAVIELHKLGVGI
jgi:putative hydrolase of the HAD superfamily